MKNYLNKVCLLAIIFIFLFKGSTLAQNEVKESSGEDFQIEEVTPESLNIEEVEEPEDPIFLIVEDMPKFMGDDYNTTLTRYIQKKLVYPESAYKQGIQGRVYAEFVVSKTGEVKDVKIVRGVDPALDEEAYNVLSTMPAWEPGTQRGTPVNVKLIFPISFILN